MKLSIFSKKEYLIVAISIKWFLFKSRLKAIWLPSLSVVIQKQRTWSDKEGITRYQFSNIGDSQNIIAM